MDFCKHEGNIAASSNNEHVHMLLIIDNHMLIERLEATRANCMKITI